MAAPIKIRDRYNQVVSFDLRGMRQALSEVEGINAKIALLITRGVGTMACAYAFAVLAFISLPSVIGSHNVQAIVAWIAQTFLQLVLLSIIMVGQRVQAAASDARAEKEFTDTETILDRLDTHTAGGLNEVLEAIKALDK
jgi:hypothetical protein